MKSKICWLSLICLCLLLTPPALAAPDEDNHQLKEMITDLEAKIEDADRRMIAHPYFLDQLRILVKIYKTRLREVFFSDSFDDGDYTLNPTWIVRSGVFKINEANRLANRVALQAPKPPEKKRYRPRRTGDKEPMEMVIDRFFGDRSNQQDRRRRGQDEMKPAAGMSEPSYIYSINTFPPDFEINLKFMTTSQEGTMSLVLLGGKSHTPRYYLRINPDHSEENPIEIIRESTSRRFITGASTKYPSINDGRMHSLKWMRNKSGAMRVVLDGDTILETYEGFYRHNFSGIALMNSGGSYQWGAIKVYRSLPIEKP